MSGLASQSSRFQSLEMWPPPFPLRSCVSLSDLIISLVSWKILCKFLIPRKEFSGRKEITHYFISWWTFPNVWIQDYHHCVCYRSCLLTPFSKQYLVHWDIGVSIPWSSTIFVMGIKGIMSYFFLCRTRSIKIKVSSSIAWSYMVITMNGEEVLSLLSF